MKSFYVVIDGLDGCGKGTQIKLLSERCKVEYPDQVVFVREPGGTFFAEKIRGLILDPEAKNSPALVSMLLFFAARGELVQQLVIPTLEKGKMVISDRGDSSTFAFQIFGEEQHSLTDLFKKLRKEIFNSLFRGAPDLYIFLELTAEEAYRRTAHDKNRVQTHFDLRPIEYHQRVRQGFRVFGRTFGGSVTVDASGSVEEVHEKIWQVIHEFFNS